MGRRRVNISVQTNMVLFLWCGNIEFLTLPPPPFPTHVNGQEAPNVYILALQECFIFLQIHFLTTPFLLTKFLESQSPRSSIL